MSKITLTEEELTKLLGAVNAGVEPSPELAGKLFPALMEKLGQAGKFDFETLNRIKIPTIEYAGKRSEGVILASAAALGQSAPLQVVRSFGEPEKDGWRNLIIQGDNLQFLKTAYLNQDQMVRDKVKGKVKLIYIDPPFATKSDFKTKDGATSYSDKLESAEFMENLRERLIFLKELLADDGSIYIHCDWKISGYLHVTMNELFGKENFRNEIIWHYPGREMHISTKYNCKHDTIFFYAKSRFTLVNMSDVAIPYDREERLKGLRRKVHTDENGKEWVWETRGQASGQAPYKRYVDEIISQGKALNDVWADLQFLRGNHPERTDYPTQKPETLLQRIIRASTSYGDIVLDVFAGSGTTAAVAEKLGRRWIVCDFGKHSLYTMQKRLLHIGESIDLTDEKKDAKYGQPPKAFAVASVGAYDFSRIMNLRENQCAYISFVLALFGIPKENKDYVGKYKLDHIYAERDGDPVEIFPVWDDQFLYNVRIDEEYLKDIITQSRGRLKGNFYIIVPESCTQVSDCKLGNGFGDEVHFRFLKFPYSILEQASRNFAIEEQPDTVANINNLVSSVGFYFNDEVTVQVVKTSNGLKITGFSTPILARDGGAYHGLAGLSLLLVDIDYNGEVFDMEHAIYAKDIPESGEIALAGVAAITAVIAIDKHGNESKPTLISE